MWDFNFVFISNFEHGWPRPLAKQQIFSLPFLVRQICKLVSYESIADRPSKVLCFGNIFELWKLLVYIFMKLLKHVSVSVFCKTTPMIADQSQPATLNRRCLYSRLCKTCAFTLRKFASLFRILTLFLFFIFATLKQDPHWRLSWQRGQWSRFCGLQNWWSTFWVSWTRPLSWTWPVHTASLWMSSRRPPSGRRW